MGFGGAAPAENVSEVRAHADERAPASGTQMGFGGAAPAET